MQSARIAASITMILAGGAGLADAAGAATPASFASRADSACAKSGAKLVALPTPSATTGLSDLEASRTIIANLAVRLKAIKAPAGKAKAYRAFVATTRSEATIIGQALAAAGSGQASNLAKSYADAAAANTRGHRQAKALGLAACAKDYTPAGA